MRPIYFALILVLAALIFMMHSMRDIKEIMSKDHEMWKATIERYDSEFDKAKTN